jgi:hypothetical protein
MKQRRLDGTGVWVSELCLGTKMFGEWARSCKTASASYGVTARDTRSSPRRTKITSSWTMQGSSTSHLPTGELSRPDLPVSNNDPRDTEARPKGREPPQLQHGG